MIFREDSDINNAQKKILFLLQTKFKDPNTEYVETDDSDADQSFSLIVTGIDKSYQLVMQLITMISREKIKHNAIPAVMEDRNVYTKKGNLKKKI